MDIEIETETQNENSINENTNIESADNVNNTNHADKPDKLDLEKSELIELLQTISGVGPSMAGRLYEAGLTDKTKIRDVTLEELVEVKGVSGTFAENILNAIKEMDLGDKSEGEEEVTEIAEIEVGVEGVGDATEDAKPPEEGIDAEGKEYGGPMKFFKDALNKVKGIFVGKDKDTDKKISVPEESAESPGSAVSEAEPGVEIESVPEPDSETTEAPEVEVEPKVESEPGSEPEPESAGRVVFEKVKKGEGETLSEPIIDEREKVTKQFEEQLGLTSIRAAQIYDAGYENLDELQEAEVQDLAMIQGINPTIARKIYGELHPEMDKNGGI